MFLSLGLSKKIKEKIVWTILHEKKSISQIVAEHGIHVNQKGGIMTC